MWEKTRENGSKRLKCDAVPTQLFFTKQIPKRKPPTVRKIKSSLKKNIPEQNALEIQNQYTSDNITMIDEDQVNHGKISYESVLKKMVSYERQESKTESTGLNVVALVSDMGPSKQNLWRKWNITAGRHCKLSNFLPHSLDDNRKLFVIPDVHHLFKNIKNMLIINKEIFISNKIQQLYNLPANKMCSNHIEDVIKYQEKLDFLLVPIQSEQDLMTNHFQKIKVGKSTYVINHDVYTALRFLSVELNKPEYVTTAWFINLVDN